MSIANKSASHYRNWFNYEIIEYSGETFDNFDYHLWIKIIHFIYYIYEDYDICENSQFKNLDS